MATAPDTYDSLIRVSKMDQRDEDADTTVTLTDQRNGNASAIAARGGKVGREFRALDQSGWTVWDSPAWKEALERVRRGESRGWAVAYDDRLGRNWRKAGRFFDEAEEAGAEILIATLPGVDYRTDDGRTMTGLLAVVAERQYLGARRRGNNIADATLARHVPNRVPYGYRRNGVEVKADNGSVTIVKTDPHRDAKALVECLPGEVDHLGRVGTGPIARRIWRMRLDRYRIADIRAVLTEEGIPGPRGNAWTKATLSSILKNRSYTGAVVLGKNRPPVEGAHVAFVSKREFEAVQREWQPVKRTGLTVPGIAGGILKCSGCGNPMGVLRSGVGKLQYGCRVDKSTAKCSRPVYVKKDVADAFVAGITLDALGNGAMDAVASSRQIAALKADVEKTTAELESFVVNTPAGSRAYALGIAGREKAVDDAEAALVEALATADDAENLPTASAWSDLDEDAQARVASFLLAGIRVDPPVSRSKFAPIHERFAVAWRNDG